ncbi:hypothetical protein ACFLUV_07345, partial [Elusimicrobiota bacterium]
MQIAFRINKELIGEILDDINIEEFSFDNIKKLYDGVKKETTKDLLGLKFKYEDNRLKVDVGKKPDIKEKVTAEEIMEPKSAWEIILSVNHPWLNWLLPRVIKNFWVSSLQKRIDIAGKYNIEQYEKEGFKVYRITDIKSNSSLDIVPDYSNKIISLVINGEPMLYFNKIKASGGMEDMWPYFNRVNGNKFVFKRKIKELGGEDLVEKGFTKKDKDGKGTVYHGMARKFPWKMKIKFDEEGLYTQSVFKNSWYKVIRKLFGRGKISVTYRLKGNELHNQKEIDNKTIASTGSHPWIKIKPGDKWHVLVPADELSVAKDMIPTGDRIKVEDSSSDSRVNLDLNLKSFKPLEGKWNNNLTGLNRDENGIATSYAYNETDGTLIEVEQDENLPYVTVWDTEDGYFAIEAITSDADALNDADGDRNLNPILAKKYSAGVTYRVRKMLSKESKPLSAAQVEEKLKAEAKALIKEQEKAVKKEIAEVEFNQSNVLEEITPNTGIEEVDRFLFLYYALVYDEKELNPETSIQDLISMYKELRSKVIENYNSGLPLDSGIDRKIYGEIPEFLLNPKIEDDNYPLVKDIDPELKYVRVIGRGHIGVVLEVEKDGQTRALKINYREHDRMKNEQEILKGLEGVKDIAEVIEFYDKAILMEYVDGVLLKDTGFQPPTFYEELRNIVTEITEKGYSVEDLNDEGIFISKEGHPVIIDVEGYKEEGSLEDNIHLVNWIFLERRFQQIFGVDDADWAMELIDFSVYKNYTEIEKKLNEIQSLIKAIKGRSEFEL